MKIEIVAKKNMLVPEKLKALIEKKVDKLDKYFDEETPIKVSLKGEGNKCKIELQMMLQDTYLGSECVAENFYDGIDICLPKIEKQIIKHRSRFDKKLKKNSVDDDYLFLKDYNSTVDKIVKRKSFDLVPMSVEEAIFKMDALGHEFFIFLEEKSNKVNVLYKRFDNDYGLIEPKF